MIEEVPWVKREFERVGKGNIALHKRLVVEVDKGIERLKKLRPR